MASHATELLDFGKAAGGIIWSNAVYFSGILALIGGSVTIPGLLLDGHSVSFVPAERMLDGVNFLIENFHFTMLGCAILFLLFRPHAEGGGDTTDTSSVADSEVSFRDLRAQL